MEQRPAQTANGERQSLTADDWATAALDAMAAGGLESVAIEPLARQLGVTKGSFYWHFANRDALIRAALERWEREETDDIIARVGDAADPYERIVRVFKSANASSGSIIQNSAKCLVVLEFSARKVGPKVYTLDRAHAYVSTCNCPDTVK